jgi:Fic family protein
MRNNFDYADADAVQAELSNYLPLKQVDADRLWKKLRLEWSFHSNHIEGNTLTYGETELLLIFDRTTGDHTKREYDEMQAHDVAVQLVREWAMDKERDLTEADIRELNKIILVKPYWKEALTYDGQATRREIKVGEYKEHPNSVRLPNGEMFHYVDPMDVPLLMQQLMEWYRTADVHPIEKAADFHYRFIRIHPFDDGNGRVARLLANYILMRHGYAPIIIRTGEKSTYIAALQKADAGNMGPFREYICQCCVATTELSIRAAKGESIEDEDDIDKEISLFKAEVKAEKMALTVKRSPKVLEHCYRSSIVPLLEKLMEKHASLDELFHENSYTVLVDGEAASSEDRLIRALQEATSLSISITRKGFKKEGLVGIIFEQSHEVLFEEYEFNIVDWKRYSYSESLTSEEIQRIANDSVKKHFEDIKAKSSAGDRKK